MGFDAPVMENSPWTVRYSDLDRLVEDLRGFRCSNPLQSRPRHLLTANWWSRIMDRYPVDDSENTTTLDFVMVMLEGCACKLSVMMKCRYPLTRYSEVRRMANTR